MEQGMVDIPESAPPNDRIDSRTGLLTSQAVRPSAVVRNAVTMPGSPEQRLHSKYAGAETQDFELRTMK